MAEPPMRRSPLTFPPHLYIYSSWDPPYFILYVTFPACIPVLHHALPSFNLHTLVLTLEHAAIFGSSNSTLPSIHLVFSSGVMRLFPSLCLRDAAITRVWSLSCFPNLFINRILNSDWSEKKVLTNRTALLLKRSFAYIFVSIVTSFRTACDFWHGDAFLRGILEGVSRLSAVY